MTKMQSKPNFLNEQRAQVSMEMILITGGAVIAALTFYSLSGSIRSISTEVRNWIDVERSHALTKVTR